MVTRGADGGGPPRVRPPAPEATAGPPDDAAAGAGRHEEGEQELEERPRRWPLVAVAVVALGALGWFAVDAFEESVTPHHAPADVAQAAPSGTLRLAGVVADEGLDRDPETGAWTFALVDDTARVEVRYGGRVPETLRPGAETVAEGELGPDGTLEAETVLTQCASRFEEEIEP